jgi:hypothetical protein
VAAPDIFEVCTDDQFRIHTPHCSVAWLVKIDELQYRKIFLFEVFAFTLQLGMGLLYRGKEELLVKF